ncbi:NlpC/P60 family protein [Brachyspira innocens]|uniref:NlpC/P60 family protein n=1 Tax=Brachyspira innocens TaxID=13264 RepID=A0ABT8YVF1_9SPIR|nr:NlpC/P60 family protein [Brachyspira innocens]MDO6993830.1 NlpC/P60 family protein [Brachyspira innocens]MDO7019813.1 NlpC/P60 family protein [Brachyspira innocens]
MRFYITIFIAMLSFFTQVLFSQNNERDEIVKWANYYMNKHYKYNQSDTITNPFTKEKKKVNFDCSGFVAAVYFTAIEKPSIKLSGSTANIFYLLSKENKTYKNTLPNIGDIIFFDGTTSPDKKLTHSGIVIDVDEDETITYIHATTSKGPILGYMNLKYPDLYRKDGKVINSYLRGGKVPYSLASYCFNSYGTIFQKPN